MVPQPAGQFGLARQPVSSSLVSRVVQGFPVHPGKLPLYVQVPEPDPGLLFVGTFGQKVLGGETGLEDPADPTLGVS